MSAGDVEPDEYSQVEGFNRHEHQTLSQDQLRASLHNK